MTWEQATELEPGLPPLAEAIADGRETMTTIMLRNGLVGLVGQHAEHPRLRSSEAFGVAYDHLATLYRQRLAADQAWQADEVTAHGT
jgi:hypothetical protein